MRLAPHAAAIGVAVGVAVLLLTSAGGARAAQVTGLRALHHSGQTFITWTCPPGVGWTYRIYASNQPILVPGDLAQARMVGGVGDSTWYDRRLSQLTGVISAYRVDSLEAPLGPDKGLSVITVDRAGRAYYAVTAQESPLLPEDRTLIPDANTLTHSVGESVVPPVPVFQGVLPNRYVAPKIYTLWISDHAVGDFPAMGNQSGLAYDCAVTPPNDGTLNGPLMVHMHAREGNFLQGIYGGGMPGEWCLALDDPLFTPDVNSFWYGFHESYDVNGSLNGNSNSPPVDGVVHDYTMKRVIYTLEWAERTFPIDRTRVYNYGWSMGGIGGTLLAMRRPDLIAAVMTIVAKFDFSFVNDPNPASGFNTGNWLRQSTDRLWGTVTSDLPTNEGGSIYKWLNDGWVAGTQLPVAVPPMIAFNGRNDVTVGWAEKIPFYRDMQRARQGGYFFWDNRDHVGSLTAAWSPAQDVQYIYRFRTNRSFPALSSCSADGNPGDGSPTVGDSVGCINCWVEWDTTIVDRPTEWSVRLWTRDLPMQQGLVAGPDSVTVDVTPRRLQQFRVVEGSSYAYTVTRQLDGAVIRQGVLQPDSADLLTIPATQVYHSGTTIDIRMLGELAVDDASPGSRGIRLALSRNPVGPLATVELSWPAAGRARVDLLDVSGRRVRALFDGQAAAGPVRLSLATRGLGNGVYFLVAEQRGERAMQRVVVLR